MLNFKQKPSIGEQTDSNWRSVERHINDDHYVLRFTPGMFVPDGTAAHGLNATLRFPVITFPDGSSTRACASWDKPSEWRIGKLAVTFWYTCNVGSVNAFNVSIIADAVRSGEVLGGTNLVISTADYAGPATANGMLKAGPIYTTTSFGGDDELFGFTVRRNGAAASDTNTGIMELLYLKVVHIPAVGESQ